MAAPISKALFLDRDGIFNEVILRDGTTSSPRSWEEVVLYEGLEAGLQAIQQGGYRLLLATNQPCVERGLVPREFMEEYHAYLTERYQLDGVYYCPYADPNHPLRKPNPGMFLRAADDHQLDLKASYHLGDTDKDIDAARNAGCTSLLWDRPYNQHLHPDHRIQSIEEVQALLLKKHLVPGEAKSR